MTTISEEWQEGAGPGYWNSGGGGGGSTAIVSAPLGSMAMKHVFLCGIQRCFTEGHDQ